MKKNLVTILFLTFLVATSSYAQLPTSGSVMGLKVPLYCGSTGSSTADSTRLPIFFQARIMGLTPGARYKYFARFMSISDASSTTTTGAGIPIVQKANGSWASISSPDMSTVGGHDTISLGLGMGEYTGWFGAVYTDDSRFTPGTYIYPIIVLEEVGMGSSSLQKVYITDSIQVLAFSTSPSAGNGTAIYGSSFVQAKSMVLLNDNSGSFNRPVSITYSESESLSFSNMPSWYTAKVNGVSGAWGTIIPNNLNSGITGIESRDAGFDSIIYLNEETDGVWGSDSTNNRKGGAIRPVVIKSDYAPLVKPEFEFVANLTTIVESNATVKMLLRRRYGNADTSKVSAFVVAGTATNGVDYNILSTYPKVFRPYGEVIDTIAVRVNDDFSSEPTENVAIRLINPINGRIGFQTTHSINITDNDIPLIRFDKKGITVKENDGILKVKIRMTSGSTSPTNVKVVVKSKTDSTAIPGDFKIGASNRDTTVQFPGGNIIDSLEFNISLVDDIRKEDRNDTVVLVLRSPTSPAVIGVDSMYTLIIGDNDAAPIYRFSQSTITVNENVGSIKVRVNRTPGNINQSDITLTYDSDSKNAQAGSDFTFTPQLVTFLYTDPDSFVLSVPINDDNLSEGIENAVFIIRPGFNAAIGKPDTFRVVIRDNDIPEYKISKVSNAKAPNFIPDSLNVRCALRGTVYGVNLGPVGSTQGLSFTLMDNTGGIQVYKPSGGIKGYTVAEGDSIQVYGRITQLNGMTQISQIDTILKFASNRTLKVARVVTALNESTESDLVKYNVVKLANPSQWPSTALSPNTSVTLKVLTQNDSFNIIIDSETDIDGKAAPSGFFNVVGLGAQNDPSSPYTSSYRLFPRRYTDFTNLVVPLYGFTTPASGAKEFNDSTDGFVLQCANLTSNQQISLFIKGGTASRGNDYISTTTTRLFNLTQAKPTTIVKTQLKDDADIESNETIIWVIRDNAWGTLIGPDSVHTVTIIDDESTGIAENSLATKTKVYPNPAANSVTVFSEELLIQQVNVFDVNGRLVRTFEVNNENKAALNIEGLTKGIYTLTITTDKGIVTKSLSVL